MIQFGLTLLIYKRATLGLRGKLGHWVTKYLTNRSICVCKNSVYSDFRLQDVPQGSVLSPILFTIFMYVILSSLRPVSTSSFMHITSSSMRSLPSHPSQTIKLFRHACPVVQCLLIVYPFLSKRE